MSNRGKGILPVLGVHFLSVKQNVPAVIAALAEHGMQLLPIGSRHKRYMGRECNEKRIVISAYRYDVPGRVLSGF